MERFNVLVQRRLDAIFLEVQRREVQAWKMPHVVPRRHLGLGEELNSFIVLSLLDTNQREVVVGVSERRVQLDCALALDNGLLQFSVQVVVPSEIRVRISCWKGIDRLAIVSFGNACSIRTFHLLVGQNSRCSLDQLQRLLERPGFLWWTRALLLFVFLGRRDHVGWLFDRQELFVLVVFEKQVHTLGNRLVHGDGVINRLLQPLRFFRLAEFAPNRLDTRQIGRVKVAGLTRAPVHFAWQNGLELSTRVQDLAVAQERAIERRDELGIRPHAASASTNLPGNT